MSRPIAPRVGAHGEAERVAVEAERAIEVGDPEVDVADADGRVDGCFAVHAPQSPGAGGREAIGGST